LFFFGFCIVVWGIGYFFKTLGKKSEKKKIRINKITPGRPTSEKYKVFLEWNSGRMSFDEPFPAEFTQDIWRMLVGFDREFQWENYLNTLFPAKTYRVSIVDTRRGKVVTVIKSYNK
jgi:hypothetical protein